MQNIFSERIGIASLLLLGVFSSVGWYALFHETLAAYAGATISMLLGFSFGCAFFFLGAVLWYKRWEMALGACLPFLPALFFSPTLLMLGAVVLASLASLLAIWVIHREKSQRIHFQYFRINQAGQFYFILGLSLAIASAYFILIRGASWEELVPRFRLGEGSASLILKGASFFQPELGNLNQNQTSVDAYLLRLAEKKNQPEMKQASLDEGAQTFELELSLVPGMEARLKEAGLSFADVASSEAAREYYLQSGRTQLSLLTGRSVRGEEPISLVFSQVLQHKLIETLEGQGPVSTVPAGAIPLVLAVLLFLALIPLGTLLAYFWLALGYLMLLYLLKTDQVEIKEHLDEVEELQVSQV